MVEDVLLQAGLRFLFWIIAIGVSFLILGISLAIFATILGGLGPKKGE